MNALNALTDIFVIPADQVKVLPVKPYTVIYATAVATSPQGGHECQHHVARVCAANVHAAIDLCQQLVQPGFDYQTIAAFDGHQAAAVGKHVSLDVPRATRARVP